MKDRNDEPEDRLFARALAAWPPDHPDDDFADRVVAASQASGSARAPRRQSFPVRRWGLIAVAAVLAFWFVAGRSSRLQSRPLFAGSLVASNRESVRLGQRATAVAEDGAEMSWSADKERNLMIVEQGRGNVFYRVEPGGAFVVRTPAGAVTVVGTSFRVEVMAMKKGIQVAGAALLGAACVVTVYEGRVLFANPKGEVALSAGDAARAVEGSAPTREAALLSAKKADDAPPAALTADASREDVLLRDSVQRQEIMALRQRVRELEGGAVAGGKRGRREKLGPDGRPWFDPSKDSLVAFARECRVRMDMPPVFNSEPFHIDAELASEVELTAPEWDAVNAAFDELQKSVQQRVRALYIEATGDVRGADALSASAMHSEIMDRGDRDESGELRRRIAEERAGLTVPPRDLGKLPPQDRFLRLLHELGNETESKVAGVIGKERARKLRGSGWGSQMEMAGCPDTTEL